VSEKVYVLMLWRANSMPAAVGVFSSLEKAQGAIDNEPDKDNKNNVWTVECEMDKSIACGNCGEESCEQWQREALKQRHVLNHMGSDPHTMTCENCGGEWEDRLCPVCREQEQAKARSEPIPGCDGNEPWRRP